MKANGSPTMHYRIDVERFIRCVSDFLDVPATQVEAWIQPEPYPDPAPINEADSDQTIGRKQPVPNDRNDQSEMAETARSITGISKQDQHLQQKQTIQQPTVVVEQVDTETDQAKLLCELEDIGICRSKADF